MKRIVAIVFAFLFLGVFGCGRDDAPDEVAQEAAKIRPEAPAPNSVDYSSGTPKKLDFLKTKDEFEKFIGETSIAVVKFGATWCPPCRALSPELEKQAGYFADRGVRFVEIDVDEAGDLAREMGVKSIPDSRVYLEGREYAQVIGYEPHQLANLVESLCSPASDGDSAAVQGGASAAETTSAPETTSAEQEETPLEKELWPEE